MFSKHFRWFWSKWYVDLLWQVLDAKDWYRRLVKLVIWQTTCISKASFSCKWQEPKSNWFKQGRYMLTHIIGKYGSSTGLSKYLSLCWLSNDVIRIWFHPSSFGFVFLLPLPSERPFVKVGETAASSSVCICYLSNFIGEVKGPWLSLIGEFCHIPIPITFRMF